MAQEVQRYNNGGQGGQLSARSVDSGANGGDNSSARAATSLNVTDMYGFIRQEVRQASIMGDEQEEEDAFGQRLLERRRGGDESPHHSSVKYRKQDKLLRQ